MCYSINSLEFVVDLILKILEPAQSWNKVLGANIFPEKYDKVRSKSEDPSVLLSEFKELLSNAQVFNEVYQNYVVSGNYSKLCIVIWVLGTEIQKNLIKYSVLFFFGS